MLAKPPAGQPEAEADRPMWPWWKAKKVTEERLDVFDTLETGGGDDLCRGVMVALWRKDNLLISFLSLAGDMTKEGCISQSASVGRLHGLRQTTRKICVFFTRLDPSKRGVL